jgi:hypothetical protein
MAKPGETMVVSLVLENKGNQTVEAYVEEAIPGWAKLESDSINRSQRLVGGEKCSLSYEISIDKPGEYDLPESTIAYANAKGDLFKSNSSSLTLEVDEERVPAMEAQNAQEPPGNEAPGAEPQPLDRSAYDRSDYDRCALIAAILISAIIYYLLGRVM